MDRQMGKERQGRAEGRHAPARRQGQREGGGGSGLALGTSSFGRLNGDAEKITYVEIDSITLRHSDERGPMALRYPAPILPTLNGRNRKGLLIGRQRFSRFCEAAELRDNDLSRIGCRHGSFLKLDKQVIRRVRKHVNVECVNVFRVKV